MAKLKNDKHEAFCQFYVTQTKKRKLYDRAQAYIDAGYKPKTKEAAYNSACRLLDNVGVHARIEELKAKAIEKLELDRLKMLLIDKNIIEDKMSNYVEFGTKSKFDPITMKTTVNEYFTLKNSDEIDTSHIEELQYSKKFGIKIKTRNKDNATRRILDFIAAAEERERQSQDNAPIYIVNDLPEDDDE